MLRSLLFLSLAAALAGCKTVSSNASGEPRFSWQKADAPEAAYPGRAIVRALRPEYSLIELSAVEKRDPGSRLQLTKGGKNFVVEVIKADDKTAVVSLVIGQAAPELSVGDDLAVAALAQ